MKSLKDYIKNLLYKPSDIPNYSIFSPENESTLSGHIYFESMSFVGRLFRNKKPKRKKGTEYNLLNLGCGDYFIDGFINADFFTSPITIARKILKRCQTPDWLLDIRFPLNCPDNYWDGVLSEHVLEHLTPTKARNLLKEINRTLKDGAWLRLSVPDLDKYLEYCNNKDLSRDEFKKWETGAEAIRSLTQHFMHSSVWNYELLSRILEEIGFVNVRKVDFLEGTDTRLLKNKQTREWESLYIEAQKCAK